MLLSAVLMSIIVVWDAEPQAKVFLACSTAGWPSARVSCSQLPVALLCLTPQTPHFLNPTACCSDCQGFSKQVTNTREYERASSVSSWLPVASEFRGTSVTLRVAKMFPVS